MIERRGDQRAAETGQQPVLSPIEPPSGGRGASWRLAAGAVTLVLVLIIAAGRFGMDEPIAAPELSPAPTLRAEATAVPAGVAAATPSPRPPSRPLQPSTEALPDVPRHRDGIPTSIRGERVFRVSTAVAHGAEQPILIGGWYLGPDCLRVGRCVGRLADRPSAALRSTLSVALEGLVEQGTGARVLRALPKESCFMRQGEPVCFPALSVLEVVWRGDIFTQTVPIGPQPLLSALQFAFPDMRAEPFRDVARCPVAWPPQTYRSTGGGPRMTLVFPTVEDRRAVEAAIVENWPRPAEGTAGQCTDHFMALSEPSSWISHANVMLWLSERDDVRRLAEAALLDAITLSGQPPQVIPAPITPWAAVSALRNWESGLDILPPHDHLIWGPGLDTAERQLRGLETYALSDPFVRLLLIFPSRAERRAYQDEIAAGDVIVLSGERFNQRNVGRALREVREAEVRWLGFRNLLLQVSGPERFDRQLRDVMAEALPSAEAVVGRTGSPKAAAGR